MFDRYVLALLFGCCGGLLPTPGSTQALSPPATPAATPVPFHKAVLQAANAVFSKANLEGAPDKVQLVIDPLIDSDTGAQSNATRLEARLIADLVRRSYRRFDVVPFTTAAVAKSPFVLIGTLTHLNSAGVPGGRRDAYRVWLTLMDLKSNRIVAKSQARAMPDGVDPQPTTFFAESPVYAKDTATEAYVQTCHATKVGDAIPDAYAQRVLVAALTSDATEAYQAHRYKAALELYEDALRAPGGEQLRVLNGLYLANLKLNRPDAAASAFGKVVDFGLQRDRLAVKFLFRPGSTQFVADRRIGGQYPMWLREIGSVIERRGQCLEVVGHTSPTGPIALNEQLSLARAEHIRAHLRADKAALDGKLAAKGMGPRELIVGTGRDDASDALDRRVEFKTIGCDALPLSRGT
jgi:outer membrane protein OmpA-like peptidoglycan-associated protein